MIVIIGESDRKFIFTKGDTFTISYNTSGKEEKVLEHKVEKGKIVNYVVTFIFALEDGSVAGFNIAAFLGMKEHLPEEIKNAIHCDDLTNDQKEKFLATGGIKLDF